MFRELRTIKNKDEDRCDLYIQKYELHEAIEVLNRPPKFAEKSASQDPKETSWAGGTIEETAEYAEKGHQDLFVELNERARRLFEETSQLQQANSLSRYNDVSGGSVDVGAYLSGEPDCMTDFRFQMQPERIVRIIVHTGVLSDVPHEEYMRRAGSLYVLIRALELNLYSVDLTVCCYNRNNNYGDTRLYGLTNVKLKEAGEHIDPAVAAFWLGHTMAFRRGFFRLEEECPEDIRDRMGYYSHEGYGKTQDLTEQLLPQEQCVYFPSHNRGDDYVGRCYAALTAYGIDFDGGEDKLKDILL